METSQIFWDFDDEIDVVDGAALAEQLLDIPLMDSSECTVKINILLWCLCKVEDLACAGLAVGLGDDEMFSIELVAADFLLEGVALVLKCNLLNRLFDDLTGFLRGDQCLDNFIVRDVLQLKGLLAELLTPLVNNLVHLTVGVSHNAFTIHKVLAELTEVHRIVHKP